MTSLQLKYRDKVSVAEENKYVEKECPCDLKIQEGICKGTNIDLAPYFSGVNKAGVAVPPAYKAIADDYQCWYAIPPLDLKSKPSTLKTPEEVSKLLKTDCFKCRQAARDKIQSQMVFTPNAKFWIGVGAASAGLLVATMAALVRRR
jgi:hypothetical protein